MKVDGGCHCGFVKFEAEIDPATVALCHCTDCQTLSGSAYRTNVRTVDRGFRLLAGEPTIYVKTAESGTRRAHAFCPRCGTPIYATSVTEPRIHGIRVGSLRQRAELKPQAMGWCRSAQDWVMDLSGLARSATQRS